MSFLVDSDTCSAHLKGLGRVTNRFLQYTGQLHLSVVTIAELKQWLFRKNTPGRYLQSFVTMLQDFAVLIVDEQVAQRFGELGAELLDKGLTVATPDLLIAATALIHDLTLVTHNTPDYVNIPGLRLTDWLVP